MRVTITGFGAVITLLVMLGASPALAQGDRGTFNGVIVDASGGVIPGAQITAANRDTGVETTAVTTDAGIYRMPYLPPGTYRISVALSGFRTAVADNVILRTGQTLTIDFKLEVGEVSNEVTVTDKPILIEKGTAELSKYVTTKEFIALPVLVDGTQRMVQTFINATVPGAWGSKAGAAVNGGQFLSHEVTVEGVSVGRMDLNGSGTVNELSVDALREMKLQTGTIGASSGGGQSAVVNYVVKSGTNDLHGSAFLFAINEALMANSWSNNNLNRKRDRNRLYNYGYTVGGPVYIPGLYDGRNKTFFFTSLEGSWRRNWAPGGMTTLPTAALKKGDFSALFNPAFTGNAKSGTVVGTDVLGRPVVFGQIYDPSTTREVNGQIIRDPFPGNIIPASAWSTVSGNMLSMAPTPDPINGNMLNNALSAPGNAVQNMKMAAFKVEHQINDNHRVSTFVNTQYSDLYHLGTFYEIPPGSPANQWRHNEGPSRMVRVSEDWTIGPTVLNHFAIGYNRVADLKSSPFLGEGWAERVGIQNTASTSFPTVSFTGLTHQSGGLVGWGQGSYTGAYMGSTIVQDDMTVIRGKHNFKFGFELRKYYDNERALSGSGTFSFGPAQTQLPGFVDSTGHAFASFLLGAVGSASRGVAMSSFGYRVSQPGFYFADDWKVTPKLTLNLGVRWEIIGGYNEVCGRMANFDPFKPNDAVGGRLGALVWADDLGRKGFQDTYYKMVSPRLGFAYAITPKMVIRGGYGINNGPNIRNGFVNPMTNGYNGSISVTPAIAGVKYVQYDPAMNWDSPFPSLTAPLPDKRQTPYINNWVTYTAPDSNRVGYSQNYSLGIQYELPFSTVLEVSYIGNKGTRLEANGMDTLNQAPLSALSYGDELLKRWDASTGVPEPYPGFSNTLGQALKPYPQYGNVQQVFANFGTSHYDSLQISANRHFTDGLSVLASYTFSKTLVTGSENPAGTWQTGYWFSQDVYDRSADKSVASFHLPHYFKLNWVWELPVGKGQRWSVGRFLNPVIGNWTLSASQTYRSGDPLSVATGGLSTVLGNGGFRPDVVPGEPLILDSDASIDRNAKGDLYLNPAAFTQVPRYVDPNTGQPTQIPLRPGNAPRFFSNLRGPANPFESMTLIKQFFFTETANVELRADMINVFNRAGRGNPVNTITDTRFGKILAASNSASFMRYAQPQRTIQLQLRVSF